MKMVTGSVTEADDLVILFLFMVLELFYHIIELLNS
jgi:hypothetical protein